MAVLASKNQFGTTAATTTAAMHNNGVVAV